MSNGGRNAIGLGGGLLVPAAGDGRARRGRRFGYYQLIRVTAVFGAMGWGGVTGMFGPITRRDLP